MNDNNELNRLGDADKVKPGRLESDADIYQKRETLTPKENTKNMSKKDKWYYFKDYYLKVIIVLVCLVCVGIYVATTIFDKKDDEELYVGYVDCLYSEDAATTILEEFAPSIGKEYSNTDYAAESFFSTWTDNEWLSDYVDRGQLDVLVMDEQLFKAYAAKGILLDLSKYLDKDYSSYLVSAKDNNDKDATVGFQCNSIQIYTTESGEKVDAYLAILKKSSQIDNAIDYLKFSTKFEYASEETATE